MDIIYKLNSHDKKELWENYLLGKIFALNYLNHLNVHDTDTDKAWLLYELENERYYELMIKIIKKYCELTDKEFTLLWEGSD